MRAPRRLPSRGRRAAMVGLAVAVAAVPAAGCGGVRTRSSQPAAAGPAGARVAAQPPPAIPPGPGQLVARVLRPTYMSATSGAPSVARLLPRTEMGSARELPVVRRRGAWLGVLVEERPNGRIGWLHLDSNLRLTRVRASVSVSLSRRRLIVHRPARHDVLVRVAVGAPGTPTPTGRFAVTDRLASDAPTAYGCCVLALSGHQPYLEPGWTGGNRIAIHSTFETSAIGQAVSHGCLRADDRSMRRLLSVVPLGTVVTIRR